MTLKFENMTCYEIVNPAFSAGEGSSSLGFGSLLELCDSTESTSISDLVESTLQECMFGHPYDTGVGESFNTAFVAIFSQLSSFAGIPMLQTISDLVASYRRTV